MESSSTSSQFPDSASRAFQDTASWIQDAHCCLILTHVRPDGDALGSLIGTHLTLHANGFKSTAFLNATLPSKYQRLFGHEIPDLHYTDLSDSTFQRVLFLDTATEQRINAPETLSNYLEQQVSKCNIDHHHDNTLFGHVNWIDASKTATSQMMLSLFDHAGFTVPDKALTAFLAGIVTDCGGFRFGNTSAQTFDVSASLLRRGAEYDRVVDELFFREPYGKLLLKARLLENAHFLKNGCVLLSTVYNKDLQEFGLVASDTEDIIDTLRTVDGVEITCLLQEDGDNMRVSFRSRSPELSVAEIAHELDGGGHPMAAGAKLIDTDAATAESTVKQLLTEAVPDEYPENSP